MYDVSFDASYGCLEYMIVLLRLQVTKAPAVYLSLATIFVSMKWWLVFWVATPQGSNLKHGNPMARSRELMTLDFAINTFSFDNMTLIRFSDWSIKLHLVFTAN